MLLFIIALFAWCWILSLFQYISCYCLSAPTAVPAADCTDFNTSHVTVYQSWSEWLINLSHISIHLMLLFIAKVLGCSKTHFGFQYISCYCLSSAKPFCNRPLVISIHLLLLFISSFVSEFRRYNLISIHLMLLFILHTRAFIVRI